MEQYASVDLEMDDDMIDDDDLLVDMEDEEADVPETREVMIQTKKDQKIRGALEGDGAVKETMRKPSLTARQGSEKVTKPQKDKPQPSSINKRRGARSPDTKD